MSEQFYEKTNSIKSVPDFIKELWSNHEEATFFRGQTEDWSLLPSLYRNPKTILFYEDWKTYQLNFLEKFSKHSSAMVKDTILDKEDDWLIMAQHFGVPTCLLDFSLNPLKALYFGCNDYRRDNADGYFWSISIKAWREHSVLYESKILDLSHDYEFILPKQLDSRIVAQEGVFCAYIPKESNELPNTIDTVSNSDKIIDKIIKWKIPSEKKKAIRRELASLGIRPRTLFPDLFGLSEDIKFQDFDGYTID
jgi:hypothetical protein